MTEKSTALIPLKPLEFDPEISQGVSAGFGAKFTIAGQTRIAALEIDGLIIGSAAIQGEASGVGRAGLVSVIGEGTAGQMAGFPGSTVQAQSEKPVEMRMSSAGVGMALNFGAGAEVKVIQGEGGGFGNLVAKANFSTEAGAGFTHARMEGPPGQILQITGAGGSGTIG